ncbi:MAG TPA: DUF4432 family protein, partial [Clostridia bacterium]|nr:DUF4432 family protein [Clostridia bacterium]
MNMPEKREDFLRYVSNISQVAGVFKVQACEGKAKDTTLYQVKTGSGLEFSAIADKCLDLFNVTYKGVNIGFLAKNGLVGNGWFNNYENEFVYYFTGGMLTTCGLQNTGGS